MKPDRLENNTLLNVMRIYLSMQLEIISREPSSDPRSTSILFIHPIGHAAWYWDEHFLPNFAQHGYPSSAVSLRGHGKSEGQERLQWTSVKDYLADITQVISQFPKPPVLVGDSLGGVVVRKYLESQTVPAVVLMSPASQKGALSFSFRLLGRHPLVFLKLNFLLRVYPLLSTPNLYREFFCTGEMPEEKVRQYQVRAQDDSYRMYADLLFGFAEPKLKRTLPPVLVLAGERDKTFPKSTYEAIAHEFRAELSVLPGLPHAMALAEHWQVAANRILDWMEQHL